MRWSMSFLAVMAMAGGTVWSFTLLPHPEVKLEEPPPAAIAIDLAPEPTAAATPTDAPPGPQQTVSQTVPDLTPPPEVAAPPSPAPNPPVPLPKPEKPKVLKKKIKALPTPQKPVPDRLPPATETTAPPSSSAPPSLSAATPVSGASSARASHEKATWQGELLARLEHFKRYPAEAQARRQEGTTMLHFSMDRKGHVLSASIGKSSGQVALDAETLALVRRAEPLPVPPDSIPGDPLTLTVPVAFYLHENGG
ncbi:energy transducer TonB [Acetobacter conturbans]|uniref:TonB family protein n=1 Tax=Acetobacter conturbans TaxID=1737472 RepID=A0ABX0JXX4_9PROT|nr:energy transducer TonB [Acetobacter conturbans]NHN88352.1 TonB family protein [Acetobacter conturbans]